MSSIGIPAFATWLRLHAENTQGSVEVRSMIRQQFKAHPKFDPFDVIAFLIEQQIEEEHGDNS
jgi:hypothetical protein